MNTEKIMFKLQVLLQGSLKILLVEENLSRQFSMSKKLKLIYPGVTIHCVQNQHQAQSILWEPSSPYDFVISDSPAPIFFTKPLRIEKRRAIQTAFQEFMQQFYAARIVESDSLNLGQPGYFFRGGRASSAA